MKQFTKISSQVISDRVKHHKTMLSSALRWMNKEIGRYVEKAEEVPWFYNERATLGFFISGLIRESDAVVLQEFSCHKGMKQRKSKSLGRSDLFFVFKNEGYLLEAKWSCNAVNQRSNFTDAEKWAREALEQANLYRKDAKVNKPNVFSLCFEAIYCINRPKIDYAAILEEWRIKQVKDINGLDFYSLIEVTPETHKNWYRYNNFLYPALAVYGLFNHR